MQFDALFIDRINLRMANHGRKLIVEYCFLVENLRNIV